LRGITRTKGCPLKIACFPSKEHEGQCPQPDEAYNTSNDGGERKRRRGFIRNHRRTVGWEVGDHFGLLVKVLPMLIPIGLLLGGLRFEFRLETGLLCQPFSLKALTFFFFQTEVFLLRKTLTLLFFKAKPFLFLKTLTFFLLQTEAFLFGETLTFFLLQTEAFLFGETLTFFFLQTEALFFGKALALLFFEAKAFLFRKALTLLLLKTEPFLLLKALTFLFFQTEAFLFLPLFALFLSQRSLAGLFLGQFANSFVEGVLVDGTVPGEDGFTHCGEFLLADLRDLFFGRPKQAFNIVDQKVAIVTVEVLTKRLVERSLFGGNRTVLGHEVLKCGQHFGEVEAQIVAHASPLLR
jgi:hypothetical protein